MWISILTLRRNQNPIHTHTHTHRCRQSWLMYKPLVRCCVLHEILKTLQSSMEWKTTARNTTFYTSMSFCVELFYELYCPDRNPDKKREMGWKGQTKFSKFCPQKARNSSGSSIICEMAWCAGRDQFQQKPCRAAWLWPS